MKMVYVFVDADKDVIGVYTDWKTALKEYIDNAEDMFYYLIDEDEAIAEIQERLYHDGDSSWWNVLYSHDDERFGMIVQRPLITKKNKNF